MLRRRALNLSLPWLTALPRAHAAPPTGLLLVLAVDASGSVDMPRFNLQRDGYAAAFRHPTIRGAILNSITGSVAVTMLQWTGPALQTVVVDWSLLDSEKAIEAFATGIDKAERMLFGGGTSLSGAIDFAAGLFALCPWAAERRVIDVSGDGSNNRGREPAQARDDAVRTGIVINGLPILALEPWLGDHYRDHVIGGPGCFMIAAADFNDFAQAIRAKLVAEIAGVPPRLYG